MFIVTVLLFVATGCSGQSVPVQELTPEERAVEPTAAPESTLTPTAEPTVEPTPDRTPVFKGAACPMDLPPGAVEGEVITCG